LFPARSYIVSDTTTETLAKILGHAKSAGYAAQSITKDP
jgi:hypothetical protein